MKKGIVLLLFLFTVVGYSQEDAWVYFIDKPNSQYYFDHPLEMLSQRALDRRVTQQIPLDLVDIPIHQPYVDQVEAATDITVFAHSKWLNAVHVRGTKEAITALRLLSFVDHIYFANRSLNTAAKKEYKVVAKVLETQTVYNYGNSANQIQMLNGHLLHQQNYTGSGKIIAIMDAGFPNVNTASPFQRLRTNNQILGGYNFVGRNTNYYSGSDHGTMVLSTMGGYVDNQLVGTAPDACYYLFITEDVASENPLEESLWVEAAERADSLGVDVINTSLSYFGYDNTNYSYTRADLNGTTSFISRGADKAFSRGMIVVVSAGNSGASSNPYVAVPADAIHVLTVGAVTSGKNYASFSSIGPSFDGRVKPDVMAQGQSAVVADAYGNLTTASGTSFSGPIIAGMVASFWQAFPNFTNAEIIKIIKQSADRFATPNEQYGYGIPNFKTALDIALTNPQLNTAEFSLYPNPAKDLLTIAVPAVFESFHLRMYNNLGQIVLEQECNQELQPISIASLSKGIYFYTISTPLVTKTGKLIKQ